MNNNRDMMYCSNCQKSISTEDKYCKYCGASASEGEYEPSLSPYAAIYGPPPLRRIHKCESCGYSWETFTMLDRQRFCPKCGGNAPYTEVRSEEW